MMVKGATTAVMGIGAGGGAVRNGCGKAGADE